MASAAHYAHSKHVAGDMFMRRYTNSSIHSHPPSTISVRCSVFKTRSLLLADEIMCQDFRDRETAESKR